MNAGVVVEGPSDDATFRRIFPRIRNDIGRLQVRQCGGKHRLRNMFLGLLKGFQGNPAWQIDNAFVILDSDCKPAEQIENQLQGVLAASGYKPNFGVEFFAVPCMLESWLLSDLSAIENVAKDRSRYKELKLQNIEIAPRQSQADKGVFLQVLTRYGLPATPPVYAEIAGRADLTMIGKRCGYFREFMKRIQAV